MTKEQQVEQAVRKMDFDTLFEHYKAHAGAYRMIERNGITSLDRITIERETDRTKMYTTEDSVRATVIACKLYCDGKHSF